jgi:hypothetical protein
MDTVIDHGVRPIGPIQERLACALIVTAAHDAEAISRARRLCRSDTADFRNDRNLAAELTTLTHAAEPTMMAFFLPMTAMRAGG